MFYDETMGPPSVGLARQERNVRITYQMDYNIQNNKTYLLLSLNKVTKLVIHQVGGLHHQGSNVGNDHYWVLGRGAIFPGGLRFTTSKDKK